MTDWLMKTIRAEARRLLELAADDPELRADLRALAEEILGSTAEATPEDTAAPAGTAEPLRPLTLGQACPPTSRSRDEPVSLAQPSRPGQELTSLESLCRQKAEAARWAAESHRRTGEGYAPSTSSEDAARDQELVGWVERLCNGFYWTSPEGGVKTDLGAVLDEMAGCLEAVAESLALAREARGHSKAFENALALVAEAQSALRRANQSLQITNDPDQESVYEWLRATAARHRVYLHRHMRADDLADPSQWPSLLARVEQARGSGRKSPRQTEELDRIRLHQTSIREGRETEGDWRAVIEAVDRLIAGGVPPSDRDLRDLLLPILDQVPDCDDLPRDFQLVLREIDRYLATRPSPAVNEPGHEPAEKVKAVARLLAGKTIVLIGGRRRRESQEALRKAFGLESLVWIETREHQSVESFKPVVARPEVAVILLAIRWSSHAFGEVRLFCERQGKPLVRLPAGYGPNQVAAQILAQSSEQLGAAKRASATEDQP